MKLQQIDGEPIGTASNFTIPATSNGMVYVGTLDGHVLGFGVTTGAALQRAGTAEFAATPVGSATTRTATVTASRAVTVTGINSSAISSPDPFTIGQVTETTRAAPVYSSPHGIVYLNDKLESSPHACAACSAALRS